MSMQKKPEDNSTAVFGSPGVYFVTSLCASLINLFT